MYNSYFIYLLFICYLFVIIFIVSMPYDRYDCIKHLNIQLYKLLYAYDGDENHVHVL